MISRTASRSVVRTVAIFEAAKGILVLLVGCGMLTLLHRDARVIAVDLIDRLHLNPSRKYPGIFIEAASRVTDKRLWFIAGMATVYALFRLLEAYGLWRQRAWGEWIALISGMIYLPIEAYEVMERLTLIRLGTLVVNLAIVIFMAQVLWRSVQTRAIARNAAKTTEERFTAEKTSRD